MVWLAYSALGVAKRVQLTTQPSGAVAGVAFAVQPVGRLVDGSGVLSRTSGVTVTVLKYTGTGTLSGTLSAVTVEGVFTFTDLKMSTVGASVTLLFQSSGLPDLQSASFNVTGNTAYSMTALTRQYSITGSTTNLTYVATTGTLLFSEGFESGSLTSAGWFDDETVPITADARPGSTGSNSVVLAWADSASSPTGVGAARMDFTPSNSVYLSYWVKHSTNWVGSGQTYHPHMMHFLTTADDHWIGPSVTHLTTYDELSYQVGLGGMVYRMVLSDALNIDTSNLGVDLTAITEDRSVCGYNGQPETGFNWDTYDNGGGDYRNDKWLDTASQVITDANKNDWHHIESFWRLNTIVGNVGQPDGVMQLWVDDVVQIDRNDVYLRTNKNPTMQFRTFVLAPFIGDGSPVAQSMWIDDIEVWTARPPESDYTIQTVIGTYTVTGSAVSLNYNGSYVLTCTAGAYTASGQAAGLAYAPVSSNNEPAGYTQITNQPWNSLPSNGWYVDSGTVVYTTDATAPESPSGIVRANYPQGTSDGSPWKAEIPFTGVREIYWRTVFKHSTNFQGHDTGVNKMAYIRMNDQPMVAIEAIGVDAEDLIPQVVLQGVPQGETRYAPNLGPSGVAARGVWHTMEIQMVSCTSGVANGIIRVWLDGTQTAEYTNVQMGTTGQGGTFALAEQYPLWGGQGDSVISAMTLDYDHTYISGKA